MLGGGGQFTRLEGLNFVERVGSEGLVEDAGPPLALQHGPRGVAPQPGVKEYSMEYFSEVFFWQIIILKVGGFDCILTLITIKMEHP